MKRRYLFFAIGFALIFNAGICLAQPPALGNYHLSFKVDYLEFTDNIDSRDVEKGPYFGIELFGMLFDNLYLGGEVGYFKQSDGPESVAVDQPDSQIPHDVKLTYVPVELNLKYVVGGYRWAWAVGGGPSYNYVNFDSNVESFRESVDEWIWGGQVFMDLNYVGDILFAGINGKYQLVEGDYDNWRLGGQVGLHF